MSEQQPTSPSGLLVPLPAWGPVPCPECFGRAPDFGGLPSKCEACDGKHFVKVDIDSLKQYPSAAPAAGESHGR